MDYTKRMMFFGSCFSENIGQKLLDMKFDVDLNPFGILYNPISIANSLKILLEKRIFTVADLFHDVRLIMRSYIVIKINRRKYRVLQKIFSTTHPLP